MSFVHSAKRPRVTTCPTGLTWAGGDHRHFNPQRTHPERPERVTEIVRHLRDTGLVDRCHFVKWPGWDAPDPDGGEAVDADVDSSAATSLHTRLATVHSPFYLQRFAPARMKRLIARSGGGSSANDALAEEAGQYDSVFLSSGSGEASRRAAAASLALTDALVRGEVCNGLAVVRPPGHHAEPCSAKGFCLVNNVAVCAASLVAQGEEVLIVDWDVHHGNGTEQMFRSVANPTYLSIHRYDHGRFFPGDPGGSTASAHAVGQGPGAGHNVNVCWSGGGPGDAEYVAAFDQVVLPLAQALKPTVILVSAGFDAAAGDPLGGCKVTAEGYGVLTQKLLQEVPSAQGRVLLFLEGGYKLSVLPPCVRHCLEALLEAPATPSPEDEEESESHEADASESHGWAFEAAGGTSSVGAASMVKGHFPFSRVQSGGASPATVLSAPRSSASDRSVSSGATTNESSSSNSDVSSPPHSDDDDVSTSPLSPTSSCSSDSKSSTLVGPFPLQAASALGSDIASGIGSIEEEGENCGNDDEDIAFHWEKGLQPEAVDAILETRDALAPYWPCLRD